MIRRTALVGLALMALCVATPALATFLYTVSLDAIPLSGATGQLTFLEPTILTTSTTVTVFSSNTANVSGDPVTAVYLGPQPGTDCIGAPGPCLAFAFDGATDFNSGPSFTSVGTYFGGELVISAVPEPPPLALVGIALGAFTLIRIRRRST